MSSEALLQGTLCIASIQAPDTLKGYHWLHCQEHRRCITGCESYRMQEKRRRSGPAFSVVARPLIDNFTQSEPTTHTQRGPWRMRWVPIFTRQLSSTQRFWAQRRGMARDGCGKGLLACVHCSRGHVARGVPNGEPNLDKSKYWLGGSRQLPCCKFTTVGRIGG